MSDDSGYPIKVLNAEDMDENGINQDDKHFQEGLPFPNMYVRDYSIRIDAGKENFCAFIDLDLMHTVSISYRVV